MNKTILSTYRLQLTPDFGFAAAEAVASYLADLGVSHAYASPYLQAARGSQHGYDVVDHSRVNEELGGRSAHNDFCRKLSECGLGQILDVVPNHMAVSGPENRWWWDVLENGQSSRYANYFDVDWESGSDSSDRGNQVLLPILGNHYGRVVEAGEVKLERSDGSFEFRYYEHTVPADPRSISELLGRAAERTENLELGFLASALDYLPLPSVTDRPSTRRRHRDKEVIRKKLAELLEREASLRRAVDAEIELVNSDPDRLDELLDQQNFRLAYWRIARSDLGYRRFFDINNLIAIRVEDEDVFNDTHIRVLEWVRNGVVDGLRIDHPDGLRDPEEYFSRLRHGAGAAWIVAEKILAPNEKMPDSWPIAGTTGYDFLNDLQAVLVDTSSERSMTDFYRTFTGESTDYEDVLYASKLTVIQDLLGSDVNRLTTLLSDVCRHNRRFRDFTREEISEALCEVIAAFSVYRTYIRADRGVVRDSDKRLIEDAMSVARERREELGGELFDFLFGILTLELDGPSERDFVMRFQQLTGPVMAKGAEDTTFYRYNRLVALNEVGAEPHRFGASVADFHARMVRRSVSIPRSMLTTSTHDAKRSEDVRARLSVISEIPGKWAESVLDWSRMADPYRTEAWPDRNTEYLFYQTVVGAWPISPDRICEYMEKALRESKAHTSWTRPNEMYEAAVLSFCRRVMDDKSIAASMSEFVEQIAFAGYINGLVQVGVKLLGPGIPDIYQGCELWDFSLVDPDNRRPVDYELRARLLQELTGLSVENVVDRLSEGLPKLLLTHECLQVRCRRAELFCGSEHSGPVTYDPIPADGPDANDVLAFSRADQVVFVGPLRMCRRNGTLPHAEVALPAGSYRNVLTGESVSGGKTVSVDSLLSRFPVCVLETVD